MDDDGVVTQVLDDKLLPASLVAVLAMRTGFLVLQGVTRVATNVHISAEMLMVTTATTLVLMLVLVLVLVPVLVTMLRLLLGTIGKLDRPRFPSTSIGVSALDGVALVALQCPAIVRNKEVLSVSLWFNTPHLPCAFVLVGELGFAIGIAL